MDLNQFFEWQRAKRGRSVSIELGSPTQHENVNIWCYDYELEVGQHAESVDGVDLEKVKEEQERREFERLQKKFEGREQA